MKRSRLILSLLLLPGLTCSGWVAAQVYSKARILTVENGLSDNRVNCFYKDRSGYIWIGTRNGLSRYDGHAFHVFRPSPGNSISNEVINSIAGDSKGTIWVGTMNGLNQYDPTSNHWESILPERLKTKPGLPNNLVWDIQFSKEGLLWIASDVFEFSSYNPVSRTFTHYDWPGFAKTVPKTGASHYTSIHKFLAKSPYEFWLGTNRGLVHLDIRTGKFSLLGAGYNGTVRSMFYDTANGKVFVSIDKGKCFVYDEGKKNYSEINPIPEAYPSTELPGSQDALLWLPAATGILKIPANQTSIHLHRHIPGFSGSLLSGAVNTIYKDDRDIRWVGTDNGIALYDPVASAKFLPLLPVSDKAAGNLMGGVYFDRSTNNYFVCSLEPAMVFIVPANGSPVRKIISDAGGEPFSCCNNISADNDGNIWLLTDRHVYRYNKDHASFAKFPTPNRSADVGFRSFTQDEDGNYWFGTSVEGIFYYDNKKKKFDSLDFPFLPWTKKIGSLRMDTFRHSVWISAYASDVIRYDMNSSKMEGFEDRPGLSALNLANDILTDSRGNTWIATSGGGILKFEAGRPAGSNFSRFDMKSGLPENSFIAMCEDRSSNIWLLSERGFTAIDSCGNLVHNQDRAQSFGFSVYTSDTRSPHSIFFNTSGNELVAAVGGGLYLNSMSNIAEAHPFKVVITDIRTGSRNAAEEQNTASFLQRLPYRYNSLRFEFAGLYYGPPEEIIYEYKLSGYDQYWNSSNNYTAVYQNLPAGEYHFEVRAKYPNGQIAGQASGYTFSIVPPFWKTTWFVLGLILLACAGAGLLVHSLLQKLKSEKLLNAFAVSLYGQYSIEDICWDIARNCVIKLGFTDCVIYQYEKDRKLLIQKAAYGPKNPWQREIYNSMAIPLGKGIVGYVAMTGKMERISDTSRDARYIVDDEKRHSEITVPVFIDGKLFGVIDSEHPQKNFYSRYHQRILRKIAALCAERIARYQAEERLRGRIARDLHDEMGSTLTSINIMSKVAMQGGAGQMKIKDYLQKIKDNSGRILESMGDMVWVINPANDNFEKLLFRMKEFTAEMLEPLIINYHFVEEGVLHAIQLNPEQRKEIYMIFKEAVTNAVKYSGTTKLTITLATGKGSLEMEIADKGCGFDPMKNNTGNGLRNMTTRAAAIGAEISIDSEKDRGSRIRLKLPLTSLGYNNILHKK